MKDGRQFRFCAGVYIGTTADYHAGDGKSANETGDAITDALRHEFTVCVGDITLGIDIINGFDTQERLE